MKTLDSSSGASQDISPTSQCDAQYPSVVTPEDSDSPCWKMKRTKRLAKLLSTWSGSLKLTRHAMERRSSSAPFWDVHPPPEQKPLPLPPTQNKELPAPPLPLYQRRLREEVRVHTAKKPQRHISWSEGQINRLQADNIDLRKALLGYRRGLEEQKRLNECLRDKNANFMLEIDEQKELAHIARRILAATEEFKQADSQSATGLLDSKVGHDIGENDAIEVGEELSCRISDVMTAYSQV
ncbi:hypothetical protein J7T55_002199 [Diaporthe amygdali]|uniref:uncharacterized protein n=1 Tax=Phomopsis amygdali TaxID=1214568 RepID=UPI0022FE222E|nr:uncharacterized protein J7T55_002199 [Diaporthe amygdali]KAJ0103780.1 hypothetical protein J7T55_002199 [Diaporthe amygdali]